jgi:proteasome lid subunit RPN8/RPN11
MTPDSFSLTQAVYDDILAHARAGKPQEVCGILRGRNALAVQAVPGRNVAPDPVTDYVIDSQTLLRQFDFEEAGDEMVGIYHSHPVSAAFPSASDAWNAHYPDSAYLICSLADDEVPILRGFRLTDHDLSVDVWDLHAELGFFETRPNLFAYYQSTDTPILPAIASIAAQVAPPFYIVFEWPDDKGKNPLSRVVSVKEYDIQITPITFE